MESTAALFAADEENQGQMREKMPGATLANGGGPEEQIRGFFLLTSKPIYLSLLVAGVFMFTSLGLLTWSLSKETSTRHHPHYATDGGPGASQDSRYLGDSLGSTYMAVPLQPKAAASKTVRTVTISSKKGTSLAHQDAPRHLVTTKQRRHNMLQAHAYGAPTNAELNECTTDRCEALGHRVASMINMTANPCVDFYKYGTKGTLGAKFHDEAFYTFQRQLFRTLDLVTVPPKDQSAWQKAVAFYQACMSEENLEDKQYGFLKSWMVSLKMDLLNLTTSVREELVDMIVRLALEIGVPVIFDFKLLDTVFFQGKRAMQFMISEMYEGWRTDRATMKKDGVNILDYISKHLLLYPGYNPGNYAGLAAKLHGYEKALLTGIEKHVNASTPFLIRSIYAFGEATGMTIKADQWVDMVAKYTNGTYKSGDLIRFQRELLTALRMLLEDSSWDANGLHAVLAWRLFDQLRDFVYATSPESITFYFCYSNVVRYMGLAVTSRYMEGVLRLDERLLKRATDLFSNVRDAFAATLQESALMKNTTLLESSLRKLQKMKVHIGSPGGCICEASINNFYAGFPDILPDEGFLAAYFKVQSAVVRQMWTEQTRVFFQYGTPYSYFVKDSNAVIIPAFALVPLHALVSPAFSYGALGFDVARMIMNDFNFVAATDHCINTTKPNLFSDNMLCLRKSHEEEGSHIPELPEIYAEFENVADLVGADVAYKAFQRLPTNLRTERLHVLNLTAEKLFFLGYCMTVVSTPVTYRIPGTYVESSARCNVPLMNMNAFSAAFGCRTGERMNPSHKCYFWN